MSNLNSIKLTLLLSLLAFSVTSHAEYRVYQYYVKSVFKSPKDNSQYLVTSSLDPVSYLHYHGGSDNIKVDLLRTWTCEGYTGGDNQLCKSPLEEGKLSRGTATEGVGL